MTIFRFLTACDDLKQVPRTGWLLRGIPPSNAENVAGHSHTTALVAYLLAQQSNKKVNYERLLLMALIHDLPEAKLGDIPRSALKNNPRLEEAKLRAENQLMKDILSELPLKLEKVLLEIWEDYSNGRSWEARLVEAADRVATALHATSLITTGYSPELFTSFIDHAKKTVKKLGIPAAEELISEIYKTIEE